jgi:serine/threonine protein kinase
MFLAKTGKVQSVFRERDILMNSNDCRFIPQIYHTFADKENLYIVMEYMNGGSLQDKLKLVNSFGFKKEIV